MTPIPDRYQVVNTPQVHLQRHTEILKKYPEVKNLIGRNPYTILFIIGVTGFQLGMSLLFREQAWWLIALAAYFIGAFANHSLYVLNHDCSHDLLFKGSALNKLSGILCDVALVLPSAMGFRRYHIFHHQYLGEYERDPDVVGDLEGRLVGNSAWRKTLWLMLFSVSQFLRPVRVEKESFWNAWMVVNLIFILSMDYLIFVYMGPMAFLYLTLSTFFALGLHPVGGRWIQEHYVVRAGQETNSYYGPLNWVAFNMGFHNEHHDFMMIPWNRLPKLKKIAPEFYENLAYFTSWTKVVWKWIFDPQWSAYSRIVREEGTVSRPRSKSSSSFTPELGL